MSIYTAEAPVTSENTPSGANPQRLTQKQATALFALVESFRPDWTDWKTVMGKLQDTALYTDLPGHQIVSMVVDSAITKHVGGSFQDLPFLGVNPHRDVEE